MIYILVLIIAGVVIHGLFKQFLSKFRSSTLLEQEIGALKSQLEFFRTANAQKDYSLLELRQNFEKLQHQNKSSQVRTGFLAEALLPLTGEFPCDPKTMRFLGSPIDYISFDYITNTITFIEVKTGDSQLNSNQRAIKKMVEDGRVEFKIVRLNEKGLKIK